MTGSLQYLETLTSRQMDMQKFIADGCKEALVEEKRRFCFLVDKHCAFAHQTSTFHEKVRQTPQHTAISTEAGGLLALGLKY